MYPFIRYLRCSQWESLLDKYIYSDLYLTGLNLNYYWGGHKELYITLAKQSYLQMPLFIVFIITIYTSMYYYLYLPVLDSQCIMNI